jgi:hypothetical protein
VASRRQLLALGMSDRAMQYRVRRGGPWQVLLPGVYLAASGFPSMSQKELAAMLYAGPGSLITGPVALLHHSIRTGAAAVEAIDVLVPADRQRLFLGKPDGWWPDAGVAGEVDSRAWHLSPDDWDRTRRRHDLMGAAGIIVLHFSPRELRREPAKVTELIKGALERGLSRPRLPIRTIPCKASASAKV